MGWRLLQLIIWPFLAGSLLFLNALISCSQRDFTFIKEAKTAPEVSQYDYIVIGGGTCGCPLAATLSQGATVLVLERGGSPYTHPDKINLTNYLNSLTDTTPSSFTQQFISTDGVQNVRARALGGGTVINAGFYSRAEPMFVREEGWEEGLVKESYEWVEKVVVFKPMVTQWQSAVRDGLKEAGVLPYNGFTFDHLNGTKVGGTILDDKGNRHTAADLLTYANPNSISVYVHSTVHKILFRDISVSGTKSRRPQAYGVIFKDKNGITHQAYLKEKGEIILSAGAIGSPQTLMLSGIGPAQHLQAHGINLVLDQPMVGQHMADNPMNVMVVPSSLPVGLSLAQIVGITNFGSYIEAVSGVGLEIPWVKALQNVLFKQTGQPSMHLPQANLSMLKKTFGSLANLNSLKEGILLEKVKGPLSKGHLELHTTDPNDNPSVTFNYFKEPEDLKICVKGVKTLVDVINSKAFSRFRYNKVPLQALMDLPLILPVNLRSKHACVASSLEQFCKDTVMTIWHYHGGCRVDKVVDRDYKVMGVDSLRVVDASTFFSSPGTNPQATLMMLGRYMGQKILRERQ